jgi:hypothetical protein
LNSTSCSHCWCQTFSLMWRGPVLLALEWHHKMTIVTFKLDQLFTFHGPERSRSPGQIQRCTQETCNELQAMKAFDILPGISVKVHCSRLFCPMPSKTGISWGRTTWHLTNGSNSVVMQQCIRECCVSNLRHPPMRATDGSGKQTPQL